jgi:hypothetical protein
MRLILLLLIVSLLIAACDAQAGPLAQNPTMPVMQSTPTQQTIRTIDTAQAVIDRLKDSGLVIVDNLPEEDGQQALKAMLKDFEPFHVREHGRAYLGLMVLCDQKATCDAIYAGDQQAVRQGIISMWRSQDGLVVCKMVIHSVSIYDTDHSAPDTLPATTAGHIQQIIEALP